MTSFESSHTNMTLEEQDESRPAWGRVGLGLFYGFALALLYSFVSQVIDVVAMKDVPLAIDWDRATLYVITTCIGGLILGVVIAWPNESWKGILVGALVLVAWSLLQSALLLGMATIIFLPFVLPFVFLSLPVSGTIRLAINLHERALNKTGFTRWRNLTLVLVGSVVLAALAGSWAQMPPHAQEAVRQVNRILQFAKANPNSNKGTSAALEDVPEVAEHLDSAYVMSQVAVNSSPTGVEVNVRFDDGFAISCLIGQEGDVPYCQQGTNVFSNPGG